jgi:hypothetical protein
LRAKKGFRDPAFGGPQLEAESLLETALRTVALSVRWCGRERSGFPEDENSELKICDTDCSNADL